jgi:hypothetical protein
MHGERNAAPVGRMASPSRSLLPQKQKPGTWPGFTIVETQDRLLDDADQHQNDDQRDRKA